MRTVSMLCAPKSRTIESNSRSERVKQSAAAASAPGSSSGRVIRAKRRAGLPTKSAADSPISGATRTHEARSASTATGR